MPAFALTNNLYAIKRTGVAGIPLIEKVSQRGEIIITFLAVYSVIDGNEVYIFLREQHFRVHPDLEVVTSKAGHIFYDNHIDISGFNICQHFLEPRAIESRTADSIVYIEFVFFYAMFFGVTL